MTYSPTVSPGYETLVVARRMLGVILPALDVLEARALAALRGGDADEAQRRLEPTILAATRIPDVMGSRLARHLASARAIVDAVSGLDH